MKRITSPLVDLQERRLGRVEVSNANNFLHLHFLSTFSSSKVTVRRLICTPETLVHEIG